LIKATFLEILKAVKIVKAMEFTHRSGKGAADLEGKMIDAPMIKQVSNFRSSATKVFFVES